MADISKITVPSGTYNLKDSSAVSNVTYSGHTVTVTKRDGTSSSFKTCPLNEENKINEGYLPSLSENYMAITNPTGTGSFSLNRKDCTTIGTDSTAEGYDTTASGYCSHAEGDNTTASGYCSHAEGDNTQALKVTSHTEGCNTTASADYSHAEGYNTTASGIYSHAGGFGTTASGDASHAEGAYTTTSADYSHAEGFGTTASGRYSHAGGNYNNPNSNSLLEIGYGLSDDTRNNVFRVTNAGAVYGKSAFNSSGADYAEFIKPWFDDNEDNEDRVGYFVTIKDGKLYKANEGDYIAGITSGNPSVVGNADEDYYWRYVRDEFNRIQYEEISVLDPELDEDGNLIMVDNGRKEKHPVQDKKFDPSLISTYIERKNRKEWDYVGMLGVLPVRDDGTCIVGKYCKCGKDGIATISDTRGFDTYMVLDRINDYIVSVILK